MSNLKTNTDSREPDRSIILTCILLLPRDAERLLVLLEGAMGVSSDSVPCLPGVPPRVEAEDSWLKHAEAAEYLGISKSTLYRYACQQKIECRKLCGRLEFRRSTLERFKAEQIRPAKRGARASKGIMTMALGSGK